MRRCVCRVAMSRRPKNRSSELGETDRTPFLQMLNSGPESILDCLKKLLPVVRDSGLESILTKKKSKSTRESISHLLWYRPLCSTKKSSRLINIIHLQELYIYILHYYYKYNIWKSSKKKKQRDDNRMRGRKFCGQAWIEKDETTDQPTFLSRTRRKGVVL
jgi:hypothetical protein